MLINEGMPRGAYIKASPLIVLQDPRIERKKSGVALGEIILECWRIIILLGVFGI